MAEELAATLRLQTLVLSGRFVFAPASQLLKHLPFNPMLSRPAIEFMHMDRSYCEQFRPLLQSIFYILPFDRFKILCNQIQCTIKNRLASKNVIITPKLQEIAFLFIVRPDLPQRVLGRLEQ